MSLLETNQTQSNILKHKDRLIGDLNKNISQLTSILNEIDKLVPYLHTESGVGVLVDNQDSNSFLRYVGRKSDALNTLNLKLVNQKALKGADNAETAINIATHITNTSYVHDDYKVNFEGE